MAQRLLPHQSGYTVEKFGIVSLNTKHLVLRTIILSSAILDVDLLHPGILFPAATAHPIDRDRPLPQPPLGGPLDPAATTSLAARRCEAGTIMDIHILDLMILAASRQCSFKEMGRV